MNRKADSPDPISVFDVLLVLVVVAATGVVVWLTAHPEAPVEGTTYGHSCWSVTGGKGYRIRARQIRAAFKAPQVVTHFHQVRDDVRVRDPETDLPYPCEVTLHGHTIVYSQECDDPHDQTLRCLTCLRRRDASRDDEQTLADLTGQLVFSTDPGYWADVTSDKTQPGVWPDTPFPAEVHPREVVLAALTHCAPEPCPEGYQTSMLMLGLDAHPIEAISAYADHLIQRDDTL